jgi:hypothetical protein
MPGAGPMPSGADRHPLPDPGAWPGSRGWATFLQRQRVRRSRELASLRLSANTPWSPGVGPRESGFLRYLFIERLLDHPIEGPQLSRLRSANATVEDTRALLRLGRANVVTDLARSAHRGLYELHAVRALSHEVERRATHGTLPSVGADYPPGSFQYRGIVNAAAAACRETGNCQEFAQLALHLHAGRLQPLPHPRSAKPRPASRDRVVLATHLDVDHAFVELQRPGGPSVDDPIIDPWGFGPAIRRERSAFADDPQDREERYGYDARDRPAVRRQFARHLELMKQDPSLVQLATNESEAARRRNARQSRPWSEVSVFNDDFLDDWITASDELWHRESPPDQPSLAPPGGFAPGELRRSVRSGALPPRFVKEIALVGAARSLGDSVRNSARRANLLSRHGRLWVEKVDSLGAHHPAFRPLP